MQHEGEQTDADSRSAAQPTNKRSRAKGWILAGIAIAAAASDGRHIPVSKPTPSPTPAPLHCRLRRR